MIPSDPSLQTILTTWTFDPQVVLPLALLAGIYGAGLREAAHRERFHRLAGTRPAICFGLGLLALVLALCSPLDSYDDWSFTVHMAQHMLLLVVVPPLLLLGKPIPVLVLGLPHPVVRGAARLLHRTPWLRLLVCAAISPLGAWLLMTSSLVFWHLPPPYQAALTNQSIHALEHISFLTTALLSWWVIIAPLPGAARLQPGMRLLYSWVTLLPMTVLGVLLTASTYLWYPLYAAQPRLWSLSPLDDQRLGGLLMWVPGGLVYALTIGILCVQMLSEDDGEPAVEESY